MGDSISSKITCGGGGPSKKSISVYINFDCFSVQKSNDVEIVLMELHH